MHGLRGSYGESCFVWRIIDGVAIASEVCLNRFICWEVVFEAYHFYGILCYATFATDGVFVNMWSRGEMAHIQGE